ncbi:oxidoreductase, molybdopterin-binding domain protein [Burkholderia mallei]|nr:oxidoreductase, molybdopterin-binding domain protein [Burkholderia mallei]
MRRGLERDRPLGRHAVSRIPAPRRRGHEREIRRLQMRGRLLREHRHGHRAAPADAARIRIRRQAAAARIRIPDEAADADEARLQESEAHRGDIRDQRVSGRILGRPGVQLVRRFVSRPGAAARAACGAVARACHARRAPRGFCRASLRLAISRGFGSAVEKEKTPSRRVPNVAPKRHRARDRFEPAFVFHSLMHNADEMRPPCRARHHSSPPSSPFVSFGHVRRRTLRPVVPHAAVSRHSGFPGAARRRSHRTAFDRAALHAGGLTDDAVRPFSRLRRASSAPPAAEPQRPRRARARVHLFRVGLDVPRAARRARIVSAAAALRAAQSARGRRALRLRDAAPAGAANARRNPQRGARRHDARHDVLRPHRARHAHRQQRLGRGDGRDGAALRDGDRVGGRAARHGRRMGGRRARHGRDRRAELGRAVVAGLDARQHHRARGRALLGGRRASRRAARAAARSVPVDRAADRPGRRRVHLHRLGARRAHRARRVGARRRVRLPDARRHDGRVRRVRLSDSPHEPDHREQLHVREPGRRGRARRAVARRARYGRDRDRDDRDSRQRRLVVRVRSGAPARAIAAARATKSRGRRGRRGAT